VSECQKYGINALSVPCDGAYANFSSFQILGCNLNQPFEHLKPDFHIDPNTSNICFTLDVCHNINWQEML